MKRRSRSALKQRAAIAIGVVASLIAAVSVVMLLKGGGTSDDPSATRSDEASSLNGTGVTDSIEPEPSSGTPKSTGAPGGKGFASNAIDDPFGGEASDRRIYRVVITISSTGPAYIGYRYRDHRAMQTRVIDNSFTVSRSVRGPLPVAQAVAQVLERGSSATCRISVDGVVVSERTATGRYKVTVCAG
ncbi:hypothetical protein ASC61_01140 [Aeromicrobium sp. Root344]|uniref:MmpS family transport accessory protein n=1 Tax=Aeromicrobium sp. Root344 TaxID=1736521 RepID=UPI0006FE49A0|nr:MmpS family transport accessory protein [Aeromicrobium sp. Root344]KQV73730.1 hypothetical protein ASC61_01140 [Aeromicrobium sp. Root344]